MFLMGIWTDSRICRWTKYNCESSTKCVLPPSTNDICLLAQMSFRSPSTRVSRSPSLSSSSHCGSRRTAGWVSPIPGHIVCPDPLRLEIGSTKILTWWGNTVSISSLRCAFLSSNVACLLGPLCRRGLRSQWRRHARAGAHARGDLWVHFSTLLSSASIYLCFRPSQW